MSASHRAVTSRILRLTASVALACGVAAAAGPASAQTCATRSATPGHERLPLLLLLEEGLTRAADRSDFRGAESHLTLGSRDTLYLYDLVHGNVKVIATSPTGGLVRRRVALRLLAIEPLSARSRLDLFTPPRFRLPS